MSRFFAICFDIHDQRRLRRVSNELENFGVRVQGSLFECHLDEDDLICLKERIALLIDADEDHVRYYPLCPKDVPGVSVDGSGEMTLDSDYHII